ncbi:MAG: STAS domain-containing protein [Solirubrobacterales bacterium]|nr:STAS domain-containing protein [Solirubrobacterales bacterium]
MTYDVVEGEDQSLTVRVGGELDMSNVEALRAAVAPALEHRPARLIIDVGELGFADSSAIALWVQWANAVPELELRDARPFLCRVIETMGLSAMLKVTP